MSGALRPRITHLARSIDGPKHCDVTEDVAASFRVTGAVQFAEARHGHFQGKGVDEWLAWAREGKPWLVCKTRARTKLALGRWKQTELTAF